MVVPFSDIMLAIKPLAVSYPVIIHRTNGPFTAKPRRTADKSLPLKSHCSTIPVAGRISALRPHRSLSPTVSARIPVTTLLFLSRPRDWIFSACLSTLNTSSLHTSIRLYGHRRHNSVHGHFVAFSLTSAFTQSLVQNASTNRTRVCPVLVIHCPLRSYTLKQISWTG